MDSDPVIVVSEALANRMWPDEDPIGMRIRVDAPGDSIWRTVVGVMGDVRYRLNFGPMLMYYAPHAQAPTGFHYLVIKAAVDPVGLFPAIRQAMAELDPETPVTIRELDRVIAASSVVAGSRFVILVLGSLSALAALLAAVGIYGVLAYTVQQRTREIGIQLALGAEKGKVLATVMGRGLLLAGVGLVAGGGITVAAGRLVDSQLFEVPAYDPLTLGAVAVLVAVTAAAASYLPARRAARLDPAEVLRAE
jgi:putative ABC transport system permease protein